MPGFSSSAPLSRSAPLLCFIHHATSADVPPALRAVPLAVWQAVDLLQVRGKALAAGALEALTRAWLERLGQVSGRPRVIVNDRLDVALAAGADGAHLGQDDLPLETAREIAPEGFLLGASAHSADELAAAARAGASYAGLGAFHATTTKPGAGRLPDEGALRALAGGDASPGLPVLAIGGMTVARVAEALRVPAVTGIAVSAAIQAAPDPAAAIMALRTALAAAWAERAA